MGKSEMNMDKDNIVSEGQKELNEEKDLSSENTVDDDLKQSDKVKKKEKKEDRKNINEKIDDSDTSEDEKNEDYIELEDESNLIDLLKDINKLEEKIQVLEAEKEAVNNRLERLQADFSNYRRRNEKEKGKIYSTAVVEVIGKLLPVIDNFERALEQEDSGDGFRKGIEMIYRQIFDFLKDNGIEIIKSVGNEFDHNYHNAVMQVETAEYDSGIIVEELQKGYILKDLVIRPAMVKVAE